MSTTDPIAQLRERQERAARRKLNAPLSRLWAAAAVTALLAALGGWILAWAIAEQLSSQNLTAMWVNLSVWRSPSDGASACHGGAECLAGTPGGWVGVLRSPRS